MKDGFKFIIFNEIKKLLFKSDNNSDYTITYYVDESKILVS